MSRVKTQLVIDGKNNTKKAFEEVNGSLGKLDGLALKAGAALAGALSVGVLANWVKQSALATAEMGRMAALSGSSAEDFQRWAYASRSVGIEQDKLADIFKDVQDKVGDFLQTGGGGLADFFENIAPRVGVTAEQFRALSGPQALQLYVSSLEKANLSHSEMTFYMEAIASDAALLLPLLQGNSAAYNELAQEAEDLGLVLSGEALRGAQEFERGMRTLDAVSEGAGKQISAELVPTLNVLNGLFADSAREGGYAAEIAKVLSFGLKALASVVIFVGDGFGALGRFIGGAAAAAASAAKGDFKQAADIMRQVGEDNAVATNAALKRINSLYNGAFENQGRRATEVYEQQKKLNEQTVQSGKQTTDALTKQHERVADAAKARIREVTAAEREANSQVERLRKERIDIDTRYNEALAGLRGGGSASYGAAQSLRVGADQALRAGDLDGAKRQAQAALKMLQDLASAGENTYGFEGFINSLRGIEVEANRLEQTEADKKLAGITEELKALKANANIEIKAGMTDEEVAKVQSQIKALTAMLSQQMVITPTIAMPATPTSAIAAGLDGFATGTKNAPPGMAWVGERGPELVVFSGGEQVLTATASRNLMARMEGLSAAGLGGAVVEAATAPGSAPPNLGRWDISVGGETVPVMIDPSDAANLRRLGMKFGAPSRRK